MSPPARTSNTYARRSGEQDARRSHLPQTRDPETSEERPRVPLSDRTRRRAILGSTALLPLRLRVAARRKLLSKLELARAHAARLLIIGHPKSGNTWVRTMISRLYQTRLGIPSDFTVKSDELALGHPDAPRLLATNGYYSYEGVIGEALAVDAPPSALKQKKIVLLARNPCDIAVSWYNQFTKRQSPAKQELINGFIDHPIDRDDIDLWTFVRHSDIGLPCLIEFLNTWEERVAKLDHALIVRYEDLRTDTARELRRIADLLGDGFTDDELHAAIEWTSFDNMQKLESSGHFKRGGVQLIDPNDESTRKVRRGQIGGYHSDFPPEQTAELEALMASRLSPTFGYTPTAAASGPLSA